MSVGKVLIRSILLREGFRVSYNAIRAMCTRYELTGTYSYKSPPGRPPSVPQYIRNYMDRLLDSDREITAPKIQKAVQKRYIFPKSVDRNNKADPSAAWLDMPQYEVLSINQGAE
jgi:hypothetical protein